MTTTNTVEFEVSVDDLREHSLMIATPMYGGMCTGAYTQSMITSVTELTKLGVPVVTRFIYNESLIQRARNYCVADFMRDPNLTNLLFIDADVGFEAKDIITLLNFQSEDSPYEIIAGVYPKKNISWEKIKQAVDVGVADEDPNKLHKFVGDYVFNPTPGSTINLVQPSEVLETGTGFMMIKRSVIERMMKEYPEKSYKPDHVRSKDFDGSKEISALFDCVIDPATKRYLSEDYYFCQQAAKIGLPTYICPWINLTHTGTYIFDGSLIDMHNIGASLTADTTKIKGT